MSNRDNMNKNSGLKWTIKNSKKQMPWIIALSVSNIVLALIGTILALASKFAIDAAQKAATSKTNVEFVHNRNLIIIYGIIIFGIIAGRMILRIFAQSLSVKIQAKLEMSMRESLFANIISKEYDKINVYHSGELMNRLTGDAAIVAGGIANIVPQFLYFAAQFMGAFVILIIFDWKFTLVFLIAGIIIFVVTLFFRGKLKNLHKRVQETDGTVRSFFQETIESILVVKTFGVEEQFEANGRILQQENYNIKMKRRTISILANTGFSFVFNGGYLLGLIWCAMKVSMGVMTYGTLTAVLQLISQVQTPFVNITKVVPQYYSMIASAERIQEIEKIPSEDVEETKIDTQEIYKKLKEININNISFSYGRSAIIESGNGRIAKGDFVAIRGISGIGKSTLMQILLGVFKPTEGSVVLEFDDNSVMEISPKTRPLFSYVPQGNYLFSGTLRENIMLANNKATQDEVEEALKISCVKDFVDKLPKGLDTVIGEKGLGISEGQAQRFAIARALISDAPILLLDEATSALDIETEKEVLKEIKKLTEKTVIIITHKEAALEVCNKEIIIKDKILHVKNI